MSLLLLFGGEAPADSAGLQLDWYVQTNAPVRTRWALGIAQTPTARDPNSEPTAETVTVDKWFHPWSLPTRRKSSHAAKYASGAVDDVSIWPAPAAPETVTLDKWFQPWALPTRRKSAHAARYASGAVDNVSIWPPSAPSGPPGGLRTLTLTGVGI